MSITSGPDFGWINSGDPLLRYLLDTAKVERIPSIDPEAEQYRESLKECLEAGIERVVLQKLSVPEETSTGSWTELEMLLEMRFEACSDAEEITSAVTARLLCRCGRSLLKATRGEKG